MLELKELSFQVEAEGQGKEIIRNVSLTIPERKLIVITGPNGGGKSTLAKLIAGIEKPTGGRIFFGGEDITEKNVTERARMGISFAFQQPVRFKGIRVLDLIRIAAGKQLSIADACEYLSAVGLCARDYVDREVNASLSGGEWSFRNLIDVFQRMRETIADSSILIISHQERILNIADEIIVIRDGVVDRKGSREEIYPGLAAGAAAVSECEGQIRAACPGGNAQ